MAKNKPIQNLTDFRVRNPSQNPQVAKLQFSIALQKAMLARQGGKVPGSHPSILNRVFDVVSRPNYAVAGMFNEVVNKIKENQTQHKGGNILELPGLLGKGALGGLEGKNKVRFADVLSNMGMQNRFGTRGLAGFAADVALDPLNIVGPGVERALPALEGERAAGLAMKTAQEAKLGKTGIEAAGEASRVAAHAAQPGRVTLEVLGRPVAGSEGLYKGLSTVSRPVLQSDPMQWVSRSFRTAHTFPGRLKDMYRVTKIGGAASYNDFESEFMREIGKKLTKDEGIRVSHALNQGVDLTGQVAKSGLDLGKAQKDWLEYKNAWDQNELSHGVYRPGQGHWEGHEWVPLNEYVPHKFPSLAEYQSDVAKEFRNEAWKASKGEGPVPTIADLKSAGLHPNEDIRDIARLRAADHFRDISKADFHKRTIEEFGQEFSGKGAKAAEKAAKESGWKKLTSDISPQVGSPLVMGGAKNVYVPGIVHDALKELNRFYSSDAATTQFVRTFDNIQRIWKTGVTTPNPSHHLRNMMGDMYLNWLAGVKSPLDYTRGWRVLTGKGTVKIGDMVVDASDLHNLYKIHGGAAGFFNTDLVGGGMLVGTAFENPASKFNQGMEALRHVTAQREDWMRLANFTNAMEEGAKQTGARSWSDLERLAADATKRVRKYNFDYGDLTDFETKVRRFVPFYTFMRKNIPIQLEMIAFHPNKIARIPQGFSAISNILGTDPSHLPITEIVPQYVRDLAGIRLAGERPGGNALYMNMGLPITDISQTFSGSTSEVIRKMLGQTTPALKGGIELATHKSLFSGAPIYQGPGGYLLDQFAPIRMGRQFVTGGSTPHSIVQPGERGGGMGYDIANWFSGLGLKQITPQAERSELKRQQDPIKARLRQLRTERINKARGTGGRRR